jgi:hypothetical protein
MLARRVGDCSPASVVVVAIVLEAMVETTRTSGLVDGTRNQTRSIFRLLITDSAPPRSPLWRKDPVRVKFHLVEENLLRSPGRDPPIRL